MDHTEGVLSAEDVRTVVFNRPAEGNRGYDCDDVDAFLDLAEAHLRYGRQLSARDVDGAVFGRSPRPGHGYREEEVDEFLDRLAATIETLEASRR